VKLLALDIPTVQNVLDIYIINNILLNSIHSKQIKYLVFKKNINLKSDTPILLLSFFFSMVLVIKNNIAVILLLFCLDLKSIYSYDNFNKQEY